MGDFATIRLRIGFRTVGDFLVPSPTGVLLLNDGKGLHHSSPRDHPHRSTHTISNTPADSTTNSGNDSASNKTTSTQWTCGSLQLSSRSLQLRRRFRKLASRLVSGKEGVVLQSPRQGMSQSRRWLCDVFQTI